MPPIVPPNSDLLSAPDVTTPTVGGAPDAPLATTPSAPSNRRLTIFYQNGTTVPAVPEIDVEVDIAKPIIDRYVRYTSERSLVNNIPIAVPPTEQKRYIKMIPNAEVEFNSTPTQFPIEINFTSPGESTELTLLEQQDIVNKTLLETRGHNPSNKFVTPAVSQEKNDNRITLGSYFYKNSSDLSNRVNYSKNSYVAVQAATAAPPPMTIEQMKDIGLNIMFEAVQGDAGLDYTVRSTDSIAAIEAKMAIPSGQRLGKRISMGRFTAAYQIKKLVPGAEKPNNPNFIDNTFEVQSYGSLYNVYSQFDSLISLGQIALCVALILAYVLILELLTSIISGINSLGKDDEFASFSELDNDEKQRLLGASVLQNSGVYPLSQIDFGDIASQFLGTSGMFLYTRHRSEEAFNAGLQEFFGFSFRGIGISAGQQLASTSLKILTESGRLNVVLRELLRSGITLVEDASLNITGLASIAGIGNLIRKIRDLKIVRFINVLMGIGDKVKFESDIREAAGANVSSGSLSSTLTITGSNVSYIDSLPDARSNWISKSRLRDQASLAWSNTTAGMLTMPLSSSYDKLNDIGINLPVPPALQNQSLRTFSTVEEEKVLNSKRIPSDIVKDVESVLEADYMPFYIHDLRTNEILAFHAFLEEASEDFSVEYSAQEGYGRMDKIQIYKGTTRNVNVNFKMIATNANDHDLMWFKINRLAMMIYPQWTQGRNIEVGQNINFVQPFSQIPGATPVIRLRLGDLYKSNYSKMAISRLFGSTTKQDYNVRGDITAPRTAANAPAPAANITSPPQDKYSKLAEIASGRRIIAAITSEGGNSQQTQRRRRAKASRAIDELFSDNDTLIFKVRGFPDLDRYRINNQKIPRSFNDRIKARIVRIRNSEIYVRPERFIPNGGIDGVRNATGIAITPKNTRHPETRINLTTINNFDIFDIGATLADLYRPPPSPAAAQSQNDINLLTPERFYDPTQNPIMKAFNSSGGKGLAGVITSFKVDYNEAKGSWGTDGSSLLRAPMFVTIQLQMAVIHDITPGLDANGIMMAPIWPVGKTSNYFINDGVNPQAAPNSENGLSMPDTNDYFAVDTSPLYYNRKD